MASTDPIDQQSAQLGTDKQNLLAAIAQYGSQAHQAMQSAQDQINAQKQAAINQALNDAASRNAPQSELDQVRATVGSPYDQRLANLTQSDAARQASFAQQGSAAGNYFGQVQAALPALRNELAMKVATLQATAARQQQAQQIALANAQARQAASQAAAQAKAQKQAQPPGVSKILSDQFGGQGGFDSLVSQSVPQVVDSTPAGDYMNPNGPFWSRVMAQGTDQTPTDQRIGMAVGDAVGQNAGLPQGLGAALYGTYAAGQQAKADQQASSATGLRNSDPYTQAVTDLINGVNGNVPTATIAQKLTEVYGPDLARQVMSDYGRLLPSATKAGAS